MPSAKNQFKKNAKVVTVDGSKDKHERSIFSIGVYRHNLNTFE